MAQLNANLRNYLIRWPDNVVLTLIQERRAYQPLFGTRSRNECRQFWREIARNINNAHPNYQVNRKQWQIKSNTLKSDLKTNLYLNF
jgi:hypothetical protein